MLGLAAQEAFFSCATLFGIAVEPSINLNDYYFSSQGYEKADLIGLSREEWNESDLFSRICVPRKDLTIDLLDALDLVTTLSEQHRETSRRENQGYELPEPRRHKANALTRWLLRCLKRRLKE